METTDSDISLVAYAGKVALKAIVSRLSNYYELEGLVPEAQ